MPVPLAVMDSPHGGLPARAVRDLLTRQRCGWGLGICGMFVLGVLAMAESPVSAQDVSPTPAVRTTAKPQTEVTPEGHLKPPPTPEQKRKVIVLTSLMIAGILTVLLFLLLWIVWWSRRTHRLLRAPLPTANRGDELWYLKAKRFPNQTANRPTPDSPPTPPLA